MGLLNLGDAFSTGDPTGDLGLIAGLLTMRQGGGGPAPLIFQAAAMKNQREQQALRDQLLRMQLESGGLDLKLKNMSVADQLKARQLLAQTNGEDQRQLPGVAPAPGGKGNVVTPGMSQMPQSPGATGGRNQTFAYYQGLAQKMMQNGLPDQAQQYMTLAEKFRPKLKDTKTLTDPQSGQRVTVNFYEDGSREVVPFAPDKEKLHFADTGSAVQGLDPFTGLPQGPSQAKTMTPGEVASNQVARGNLGLSQQRFAFEQTQANKPQVVTSPNGDVYTVDARAGTGQTVTGPDGKPLTVGSRLTESQAKASVYYGQMRGASDAANKIVVGGFSPTGKDQPAYAQARAASELSDNHPVMAAALNIMTKPEAQKYQQAAEQWAESYLRYNTGAATNHSEIVRYARIFFPMPGDSPQVVAQKNSARVQAEQMMRIAANNGAQQVEGVMGGGPPSQNDPLGIRK